MLHVLQFVAVRVLPFLSRLRVSHLDKTELYLTDVILWQLFD